jgi:ankyrin repeat protein
LLLEHKADVDAKNNNGLTVLHMAARTGHEAVVRLLPEKGADIKAVALLLLEHKADVDAKDNGRETVLHVASKNGHEAVAQQLLEKGADIKAKNKDGSTALHFAAEKGHEVVARSTFGAQGGGSRDR